MRFVIKYRYRVFQPIPVISTIFRYLLRNENSYTGKPLNSYDNSMIGSDLSAYRSIRNRHFRGLFVFGIRYLQWSFATPVAVSHFFEIRRACNIANGFRMVRDIF